MEMRVFAAASEVGPEIQGKSFALQIRYQEKKEFVFSKTL